MAGRPTLYREEYTEQALKRCRRAVFVIGRGGRILHAEPWFQPGNPTQYEEIFRAMGFDV